MQVYNGAQEAAEFLERSLQQEGQSDSWSIPDPDGPSYATIFSTPVNYQGILPAEISSQVKMECLSDGILQIKYHWIHNISVLSFSENTTLPSLTWDQMGRYRCITENSATHEILYNEVQVQAHVPRISKDVTMSTLLLNFLMTWSILGYVLLFTLILLSLIRCYSTRHGGHDLMGKEVRASLLACGIHQASSQIYIAPDSLIGVERYSSSLAIENAPEDVQEYSWHRGANDTEENLIISYNATSHPRRDGPMYSGRESVSVRELEIPQTSVNTTSVVDGEDVVAATCYTNDSQVQWYVNYAPVSRNYRMTVCPDNKTLVIRMFSRFDSPLQCGIEILPELIQKSDLVYVTVAYGPYSLQLSSSPTDFSGILSAEIGSQVEMECISYSRPESKYRWMHNGSFLSFSEKNITLPSLTWDQMGRYRCIAENSATQLTLYDEVHVQAPSSEDTGPTSTEASLLTGPPCRSVTDFPLNLTMTIVQENGTEQLAVPLPPSVLRSLTLPKLSEQPWKPRRSRPLLPLQDPTMPAPQCASCHTARAALRRPRSGQALCGACFCAAFEAEVLHTVVAGRLLPPGAVVAVGASGGKDSTVLAHVLRELAPRLGISLHLVAVDEGIGGYRDAALAAVRRQAARWDLPLTVVAYADLFGGWTMDAVARSTAGSGRSRACCTFCGVLRRRALEEGARLVGATHVVTGHNADDMAETVLMNFLRGDAGRLARGGGLGSPGEGGALPRCRPLQLASQKEVVLYAHFRRLDYFSEECVYAPEAFRGHARDLLKMLEAARPSAVLDLVHSAERLALAPAARPPPPGACSRCGALASRALCQACALLDGLNRGRPRLAIGKGRRGLDEEGPPREPQPSRLPTSEPVPDF
ncbi:hypothetical protein MJG53_013290 [Ovis ammon polii x Ovis aries]|uniref:Uncharacterized protein n=1 Tax=Ovis ammon polii x Ovis aries TaxID=2918886 RepID=A0ACB9UIH7_9CETA|nr:hypothetical protein MJG53_013290 [Ovis ammon polii x Ovis aries]